MKDPELLHTMNPTEKEAWCAFSDVVTEFLGNFRAHNYKVLVDNLLFVFPS
jgi:hypothetical protein